MPRERSMDVRKIVSMPAELVDRIRRYRFAREINTEADAIRMLIEKRIGRRESPSPGQELSVNGQ